MLLNNTQFSEQLFLSISNCKEKFVACSAFIKKKALEDDKFVTNLEGKDVVIVGRWQKHDLLTGASDLDVYSLCKERGWKFGIDLNLHGKIFIIDETDIFLGSANLTQKGLHLGLTGNNEFGTRISAGQADINKIEDFLRTEVTWVNDGLFEMFSSEIQISKMEKVPISSATWSKELDNLIVSPVHFLWVQELVFSTPSMLLNPNLDDEKMLHDFELLGLDLDDLHEGSLKGSFKRSRLYRWICSILSEENLSFGGVTSRLHSAILDDPKPYRVDIKNYNKILFEWAEFLSEEFIITQPNYSQVISLRARC